MPIWVLGLDYVLGMCMWTLIGRSAMNVFLPENSRFFFMRFFVVSTDPLIKLLRPVTPKFLISLFIPLYVAWFFFMIRFYLMPWVLGYSAMGMLSFPLEGDIARAIWSVSQ